MPDVKRSKSVKVIKAKVSEILEIDLDDPPLVGYIVIGFTTEEDSVILMANSRSRSFITHQLDVAARSLEKSGLLDD